MHKHAIARAQGAPRHIGQPLQPRLRPDLVGLSPASRTTGIGGGPAGRMRGGHAADEKKRTRESARKPHTRHERKVGSGRG